MPRQVSLQLISAMQQLVNELWRIADRHQLELVSTGEDLMLSPSKKTAHIAKPPRVERATGTSPDPQP